MRTVKNLLCRSEEKVYVYIADDETGKKFLHRAEKEGFVFGDGAKPTSREYSEIMAINEDMSLGAKDFIRKRCKTLWK